MSLAPCVRTQDKSLCTARTLSNEHKHLLAARHLFLIMSIYLGMFFPQMSIFIWHIILFYKHFRAYWYQVGRLTFVWKYKVRGWGQTKFLGLTLWGKKTAINQPKEVSWSPSLAKLVRLVCFASFKGSFDHLSAGHPLVSWRPVRPYEDQLPCKAKLARLVWYASFKGVLAIYLLVSHWSLGN